MAFSTFIMLLHMSVAKRRSTVRIYRILCTYSSADGLRGVGEFPGTKPVTRRSHPSGFWVARVDLVCFASFMFTLLHLLINWQTILSRFKNCYLWEGYSCQAALLLPEARAVLAFYLQRLFWWFALLLSWAGILPDWREPPPPMVLLALWSFSFFLTLLALLLL